ncbi:MAG: cytochrome bd ubiquinol oxidase subunit [Thermoleophilaceae bacterium]|jgi:cytochrome d ubiquinol oxidase subunit II|nr:cytochrome bd ubiquinol oxidase subunit [Thermoleophilaceae bacterium]
METVWFVALAAMIAVYVVLDGFDLGAGALHLRLSRNDEEREQVTSAIGPVWNGNEVWLIAAGGVLFLAFPKVYAGAFSGLYFGLILVLWLLIGRGLALELRHQHENPLWRSACDAIFSLSSLGLAAVFGIAIGNVVRGVPLNADGYFHLPLFSILNWYALLIGLFGLVVLAVHGATFLSFRAHGEVRARAALTARRLWVVEALLFVALIAPTWSVREDMLRNLFERPWTLVFPLLALGGLATLAVELRRERFGRAFGGSAAFILGLLATMAAGLYPDILPAREGDPHGLTVHNAATGSYALEVAIVWWGVGMLLASAYFVHAYRLFFRRS